MKVPRRCAPSSPPSLLDATVEPSPPISSSSSSKYYHFELKPYHVERGKKGQKVYICDICNDGIFKRSFSLKRHYLRFHINFSFVSPRDLNNCAIGVASQQLRSGSSPVKADPASKNHHDRNEMNGRSSCGPLLYRCHQCGHLTQSKQDLLSHLEEHPSETSEGIIHSSDHSAITRCPRCSTAFSLRRTLMKHIKKNRCRVGCEEVTSQTSSLLGSPPRNEQSTQMTSSMSQPDEASLATEEEEEGVDMETSSDSAGWLIPTMFRFSCILCSKMFSSYVSMCRHRRLAHNRLHGICSPDWLWSRRLSRSKPRIPCVNGKLTAGLRASDPASTLDYSYFTRNVSDNLNGFLDGKWVHIRAVGPAVDQNGDDDHKMENGSSQGEEEEESRWSWKDMNGFIHEVLYSLDVPLQQAFFRGFELWKKQELDKARAADPSHSSSDGLTCMALALQLQCAARTASPLNAPESVAAPPLPQLSGEWTRVKSYICSPCGEMFQDFLALIDHQHLSHSSVSCTHIQLDCSASESTSLASELTRQILRSGSDPADPPSVHQCTKCQYVAESTSELHSHILLCSNHASTTIPCRKARRSRAASNASTPTKRNQLDSEHSNKGVQRSSSVQPKKAFKNADFSTRTLRSHFLKQEVSAKKTSKDRKALRAKDKNRPSALKKEKVGMEMNGQSKKKKKTKPPVTTSSPDSNKRILRQQIDPSQISPSKKRAPIQPLKGRPPKDRSSVDPVVLNGSSSKPKGDGLYKCKGCKKKFLVYSSVLKHQHYCANLKADRKADDDESLSSSPRQSPSKDAAVKPKKSTTPDNGKQKPRQHVPEAKLKGGTSPTSPKCNGNSLSPSTPSGSVVKRKVGRPPGKSSDSVKSKKLAAEAELAVKPKQNGLTKPAVISTPELHPSPARPLRSSRKSATFIMEDQVESSFLEALSPEQRVNVAEQTCPFCLKRYVYRSNFKKHLIEGCGEPASSSATPVKAPTETKGGIGNGPSAPLSVPAAKEKKQKGAVTSKTNSVSRKEEKDKVLLKKKKKKDVKVQVEKVSKLPNGRITKKADKKAALVEKEKKKKKQMVAPVKKSTEKKKGGKIREEKEEKKKKLKKKIKKSSPPVENGKTEQSKKNNVSPVSPNVPIEVKKESGKNESDSISAAESSMEVSEKPVSIVSQVEDEGCLVPQHSEESKESEEPNGTVLDDDDDDDALVIDQSIATSPATSPAPADRLKKESEGLDEPSIESPVSISEPSSDPPSAGVRKSRRHSKDLPLDRLVLDDVMDVLKPFTALTKYPPQLRQLEKIADTYARQRTSPAVNSDS